MVSKMIAQGLRNWSTIANIYDLASSLRCIFISPIVWNTIKLNKYALISVLKYVNLLLCHSYLRLSYYAQLK